MATARLLVANLRRSTQFTFHAARSSSYIFQSIPSIADSLNTQRKYSLEKDYLSFSHSSLYPRAFSSGPRNGEDEKLFEDPSELVSLVLDGRQQDGFDGVDSILPIKFIISLIDGFHDLTGFPWWIVIVSSTLTMRMLLFPLIVLQLKKLKRIREILPKLPSPIPQQLSVRGSLCHVLSYLKEKRASGCPSFLWFFGSLFFQFPMFFCMLTSVRRMCLSHHHGFDCGGTLWFRNLTEFSNGSYGLILPFVIAVLHYTNIQFAFDKAYLDNIKGVFGLLAKGYKAYLDILTLPIFFIALLVPQGSQIYWVTNSSLTIIQAFSLRNNIIRMKVGLADKDSQSPANLTPAATPIDPQVQSIKISAQNLSPKQLFQLAVQIMPTGNREAAMSLLQQAIEKDPDHVDAMILMGQALLQEGYPAVSIKLLEHAASKLNANDPAKLFQLILAHSWAGVACMKEGKKSEGIAHLRRVASMKEPDDTTAKLHYLDSLVMLAAALHDDGKQCEASEFLEMAAAYNPQYKELFERCTSQDSDLVTALVNSRRRHY